MATSASEQIRMSRAKPPRGAKGALDILICLEKGSPLRSTDFPDRFYALVDRNYMPFWLLPPLSSQKSIWPT
jgi:hypothetical protein